MGTFSEISSRNELADFLGVPRKKLTHILYVKGIDSYYDEFEIPKKSGSTRKIRAPFGDLKSVQQKLLKSLSSYICSISSDPWHLSHAFQKDKSCITNAKIHRNKRFVLNLDLKDFFDSIHFGRVCGYFEKNQKFMLPYDVSVVIAQLVCYKGTLPQGAPTSPIITNLLCEILDIQLLKISKKYRLDYTRYADDLTFSTNDKHFLKNCTDFLTEIKKKIEKAGFTINEEKTRLQYRDSKQIVTGLVVNQKINVDKNFYKNTRAMAHRFYKNGSFDINGQDGTVNQLEGRFSFIDQLCKFNNKIDGCNHTPYTLCAREKQYQMFLFYKYFFANSCPLIITEGKTDILYLKAALKNLYSDYPNLIAKNDEDKFSYKISFFRKSDRFAYFYNYSKDGADAMGKLLIYFRDKEYPKGYNYYSYFSNLCNRQAENPIILLFDNEMTSKDKPILKFLKSVGNNELKNKISTDLYCKLLNNTNLFITTNPLVDGKPEVQIEDLFDEATLKTEIDGKKFCISNDYDKSLYYGKDRLSKYVLAHYKEINFERFRPLLDNINRIIEEYKSELPIE